MIARLVLVACLLVTTAASADDNEVVERYLARLGLVDLQAAQLEQTLDAQQPGESRKKTAERLADLYAAQLIARSDNKAQYDAVLQRIRRLGERAPEAKTASLEVMLLQADYFRAEQLMTKWMADRAESAAREEATTILGRIAPQLNHRQQQLHGDVDRLTKAADEATEVDEQELRRKELERVQTVAGRAAFFAAWANYYLALSQPSSTTPHAGFATARDIFRRVLGIEGSYTEIDPAGLGLESVWRARTMIGLGMSEAATGNIDGSRACFDLLDRAAAPPEIHELSPYWRLQSLLNANHLTEALNVAKAVVNGFTSSASQGKVSFCVSLVRAGFGGADTNDPVRRELGLVGVSGLIKLRQQSALKQLIDKHKIPLDGTTGFFLLWMRGQQLLESAEKSKQESDYAAATSALAAAIAAPDAGTDLNSASMCRYQLGWCQYKQSQFEPAAKTFELALDGLKATDPKTAAEAAWMAFLCYQSLSKGDPKFATSAVQILRGLQRDFPEHPYAKRADYYAGKLQQLALPPTETIANLEKVPSSSPDYLAARFDICQLSYELWQKSPDKTTAAANVAAAVERYFAAEASLKDSSRALRCALFAVDVALNSGEVNLALATKFLETARRLAASSANDGLVAEFHFRSLQLATHHRDAAARRLHANWIVKNAAGSPFEVPALVVAASALDEQLKERAAATPERLAEARDVYARLVAQLGDGSHALQSKKNSQVAVSRLAHYSAELGRHAEAAEWLGKLLAAFPNDQAYLRRAGLAEFHAGRFAQGIELWRKLVTGLPKDSEGWFEAKYFQLACLAKIDPAKARAAFQQFRLLYPDFGPVAWRAKFGELERGL